MPACVCSQQKIPLLIKKIPLLIKSECGLSRIDEPTLGIATLPDQSSATYSISQTV
jgi:hypothetical protein